MLGVTSDTVPAAMTYLSAEPARVDAWRGAARQAASRSGSTGVGPFDDNRTAMRDIPLANFAPLAALPGVQLISLQKGEAIAQIAQVPFGNTIMTPTQIRTPCEFLPGYRRGHDEPRPRRHLRHVVTHLAGALARPVFTALPVSTTGAGCSAARTRPYPTLRIFRQGATGGWDAVLARIAEAVRLIVN